MAAVPLPRDGVRLRAAGAGDRDRVLAWNGAADVRACSRDPRPIDAAAHARWYGARIADPLTHMWIVEDGPTAMGLIRIERPAREAPGRVSLVLDPLARGRGVGRAAVRAACRLDGGPLVAEIQLGNQASLTCFLAAGFAVSERAEPAATWFGPCPPGFRRLTWRNPHA